MIGSDEITNKKPACAKCSSYNNVFIDSDADIMILFCYNCGYKQEWTKEALKK